ncbi:MAG: DUF898 family protein [Pseudomonadota bacterium]
MTQTATVKGPWASALERRAAETQAPHENDAEETLEIAFVGRRGPLFWLALKTGFLTVLTLGLYRFWMKTRLRQWYWSAIRPGGHPLEYVGDPLEKLLGFFIAVVILTFYIGILNLVLMFVSFSVFSSSVVGYVASFAGVIPLWFYARYRARRYVLARTRWRGVRFALAKGAWGYAARALLHWAITLSTLGILWPRMTFFLEKYRTDRTFFGSAQLTQGGSWTMLYRAALPFMAAAVATLLCAAWLVFLDPIFAEGSPSLDVAAQDLGRALQGQSPRVAWENPQRLWVMPICIAVLLFGAIYYNWNAKRLLANHKTASGLQLRSHLNAARVAMIYVLGNFLSYLFLIIGLIGLLVLVFSIFGASGFELMSGSEQAAPSALRWVQGVILFMLYLGLFLMWGVLHSVFVTVPLMRHMALTTSFAETAGFALISQRARDAAEQAEGFAEALDVGAAI